MPNCSEKPKAPPTRTGPPLWRRILQWGVALGLVAFLVLRTGAENVWQSLRSINWFSYLSFVLGFGTLNLLLDCVAGQKVYRYIAPRLTLKELVVVRGASYLPSLLNYHVGQAYVVYLLSRKHESPLSRVIGATLINYTNIMITLILVSALSVAFGSHEDWLVRTLYLLLVGVCVYFAVVAAKPRFLRKLSALDVVLGAGLKNQLTWLGWRLPHALLNIAALWIAYGFFGINIDVRHGLLNMPIVLMVSALPLTPQGAGTRELIALELLSPYAQLRDGTAAIVAASSAWALSTAFSQVVIGSVFFARASQFFRGSQPEPPKVPGPVGDEQP